MMTFRKKLGLGIGVLYAFLLFFGIFITPNCGTLFGDAYESIRAGLFSGLLSSASFLLAAYAFLVMRMKETVYGSDAHLENVVARRRQLRAMYERDTSKRKKLQFPRVYEELRSFSTAIMAAVVAAFVAAVAQYSVGLIDQGWARGIALALALGAVAPFTLAIYLAIRNISSWFLLLEHEAEQKVQARESDPNLKEPSFKQ